MWLARNYIGFLCQGTAFFEQNWAQKSFIDIGGYFAIFYFSFSNFLPRFQSANHWPRRPCPASFSHSLFFFPRRPKTLRTKTRERIKVSSTSIVQLSLLEQKTSRGQFPPHPTGCLSGCFLKFESIQLRSWGAVAQDWINSPSARYASHGREMQPEQGARPKRK